MNLQANKSINFSAQLNFRNNFGTFQKSVSLSDNEVLLSAYAVNPDIGFNINIISKNPNLVGTLNDSVWNPITKETIPGPFVSALIGGNVNSEKVGNTVNAIQSEYGTVYFYGFQLFAENGAIEGDFSANITNSYYLNTGHVKNGTLESYLAFDIGKGQNLAGDNNVWHSIGKLLESADGDLSKELPELENPIDPLVKYKGELELKLGSAGTGNGFNTYKLAWTVEKDSSSVDYADMDLKISFGQKADDLKLFKTTKVGKSGSLDFSYINAVDIAGWSWLDKLKEKLPVLDPSPTFMIISFLVNGVWNDISFSIKLDYDGRVTLDGDSEQTDRQYNVYRMIAGNAPDENTKKDMDDDDNDKDDDEKGDGDDKNYTGGTDSVNGSALLTTSYSLTVSEAHSFGSWLWSSTMIDDIHLVNNNPIENIVACKLFPFSVSGTEASVQLGNVTSNVTGQKLAENVARTFVMNGGNAIRVPRYYSSIDVYGGKYAYLDNAPFTSCRIYLPYLGIKELDASEVLGKDLYIKYYVDLVTGMCRAVIQTDKRSLYVFDGQIGQDVPITASNRAQVEVGYITGGLQSATQIAMGAMTGNVFGVISGINGAINTATNQYHSETHGTPTPCNSRFDSQIAYIIIDRPDLPNIPSKFAHQNGRICNKTLTISNLNGYTELDNTVDLSGIQCTDTERSELLTILSSGFYA